MRKEITKNKLLRLLLVAGLVTMVACGDDDDGGTTNITVNPDAQQERQEGPVGVSPGIRINNNVNNDVDVRVRNIRVDNDEVVWDCGVEDANPENVDDDDITIVHQQFIYVAPNCNAISNAGDQASVEQVLNQPVVNLQQGQGDEFQVQERFPVAQLPADEENFVYVLYNQQGDVNIPVFCMPINIQLNEAPTTTGGATTGGTTGGTAGGTTGGTTGGTGGTGGTNGGTGGTGGTNGGTGGTNGGTNGGTTGDIVIQ